MYSFFITTRIVFEIPILGYFGAWGYFWDI